MNTFNRLPNTLRLFVKERSGSRAGHRMKPDVVTALTATETGLQLRPSRGENSVMIGVVLEGVDVMT